MVGKSTGGKKRHFDSEEAKALITYSAGKDVRLEGNKIAREELPVQNIRPEIEIPENSTFIMDCEAAEMLLAAQSQMPFLPEDVKIPVSFDSGLSYANRYGNSEKAQTIRKILGALKKHGVSDLEICQIANIGPESVDEVFDLVPTLEPKRSKIREPLRIALDKLASL